MIITIDTDRVAGLKKEGDKILFSQEGESTIAELLELASSIEKAIDEVKKTLEESALKLDPNFVSIQGEKVKVAYRSFGARYKIDASHISELPEKFYTIKTSYSPVTKEIEAHVDETGVLPLGVDAPERPKKISITVKGVKDEQPEE